MWRPMTVMLYFELKSVLPKKIIRNSMNKQIRQRVDQESMNEDADLYWTEAIS